MNKLAEPQTYGFLMVPERGNKNILLNCLFSLQIHLSLLKRIFKNAQKGQRLLEVAFELLHLYHQLYILNVFPLDLGYRAHGIITRGLYNLNPLFESQNLFFREVFTENLVLVYG